MHITASLRPESPVFMKCWFGSPKYNVFAHWGELTLKLKVQVQIERPRPHLHWRCSPVLCWLKSSSKSSRKFDAFFFVLKGNQSGRKGDRSPALGFVSHGFRTRPFSFFAGCARMGHAFKSRGANRRSYLIDLLRASKRSLETWLHTCLSLTVMGCITLGESLNALIFFIYEITKVFVAMSVSSIYKWIRLNTHSQKPPVKRQ